MRQFLLLLVASLAGCESSDPDALAIEQALVTVHSRSSYQQAEFGAIRRGLSAKGEVGVCGTLIDGSGQSHDFVVTLGPGESNFLVGADMLPEGMLERLARSICGPESVARYETAKQQDPDALVDRISA